MLAQGKTLCAIVRPGCPESAVRLGCAAVMLMSLQLSFCLPTMMGLRPTITVSVVCMCINLFYNLVHINICSQIDLSETMRFGKKTSSIF